ncbi:MAG: cys-tRNA(pro)/cys-tRNA(cys) deacylase [Rhizobium sp.]|nr:cys-tRNA(pro)/cys-tRNA(cys) deacylase [Rhizobium sp.]
MTVASVKAFFSDHAPDIEVIELDVSTATVGEAAAGHNVEPGQIAKTLAIRIAEEIVLVVAKGTSRLDNKKFKAMFSTKPRMLGLDEVERETSHPVGGVCPFGLARPLKIYCDIALRDYDEVVPAAGGTKAAVRISPMRMAELTNAEWIDVCE